MSTRSRGDAQLPLSSAEKTRRENIVESTRGSLRIEGLELTDEAKGMQEKWARGYISGEKRRAEIMQRHGLSYKGEDSESSTAD